MQIIKNATYINVGTSEVPVWQLAGASVEDSIVEYNTDKSKITDIRCNKYENIISEKED